MKKRIKIRASNIDTQSMVQPVYELYSDSIGRLVMNVNMPDGNFELSEAMLWSGLKDLDGIDVYDGDDCENELGERGMIMFSDGVFSIMYFDEPAKQYLHDLIITDNNYCSTGVVKLKVVGHKPIQ